MSTVNAYFQHHLFFCCNQRTSADNGGCAAFGADRLRAYAKHRINALGLAGKGRTRVNSAGCLQRCELGPMLVVYPEGVWYTYLDEEDIDEIIDQHLIGGKVVERLQR